MVLIVRVLIIRVGYWLVPHTIKTNFIYGNIPVLVDYSYPINSSVGSFISVGVVFGNILNQNRLVEYNNGSINDGFGTEIQNDMNPKYFHLSLGVEYSLAQQWKLEFEPYLKYLISSTSPYSADKDASIAFGARLGVKFDFKPIVVSEKND